MHSGVYTSSEIEQIVFGRPTADALIDAVERLDARRVFLLVSRTMNTSTNEVAKVTSALGPRLVGLFDAMASHTPRREVLAAASAAREAGADLVVTFGGGSVTDAGKMVRLCLQHDLHHPRQLDAFCVVVGADGSKSVPEFDGPTIDQIAIPTTLSAGEFHAQAGCTDEVTRRKQSYRHRKLAPRVIILDPAPTFGVPSWVWLSTGVRAIDHAVEGICSAHANPIADASFVHALRLLSAALPKVKDDPEDLAARLDCQLGAWLSMAGRLAGVPMGASHAIGHVLGGTCGVSHGLTSCITLPHVLRYNRPSNEARQEIVAEALGSPGEDAGDVIATFVRRLGQPSRLSEVNIGPDQFPIVAENALKDAWMASNPRPITNPAQVIEILTAAQ